MVGVLQGESICLKVNQSNNFKMKKIITTVGTSLVTNQKANAILRDIAKTKDANITDESIEELETELNIVIEDNTDKLDLCAEISSITQIIKEAKSINKDVSIDDLLYDIYLLATDTKLSPIVAGFIQKWLSYNKAKYRINEVVFNTTEDIIEELKVDDPEKFKDEGINNLFSRLNKIVGEKPKEVILNITGGYKALTPVLTIYGQLRGISLQYLFKEEENEGINNRIIEIPGMPINYDWTKIEIFLQVLDNKVLKNEGALKEYAGKKIIEKLSENRLIQPSKKKKTDYELSILGILLNQYANNDKVPLGPGILGLYIESKLFEYFNSNLFQGSRLTPSRLSLFSKKNGDVVSDRQSNADMEIGDIDLVLTSEEKDVFLCEVKSYGQTKSNGGEKIIKRIEAYKKYYDSYPSRFSYFIYSVDLSSYQSILESNKYFTPKKWFENPQNEKLKILSDFKGILAKEFVNIPIDFYCIEIMLTKGKLKINYSSLLKVGFIEDDIQPLNDYINN